ncbi:MAG: hypothetical protein SFT81_05255 [Candidatus Caenarcaniphilales bacterium]|nr:hypothetical protein [Candidatus Caenarcaniphilales bacterium]
MSKDEFEKVFEDKILRLKSLKESMSETHNDFLQATVVFVRKWINDKTQFYLQNLAERTLSMSHQELADFKADVFELIRDTKDLVSDELGKPYLWWHLWTEDEIKRNVNSLDIDYVSKGLGEDSAVYQVDLVIRHIIGFLGDILEDYGYINLNLSSNRDIWVRAATTRATYYAEEYEWSEDMTQALSSYGHLYRKAHELSRELIKLENEVKKLRVRELWESLPLGSKSNFS